MGVAAEGKENGVASLQVDWREKRLLEGETLIGGTHCDWREKR